MKILIHTGGSYGDISPFITLAIRLRELGHEPILAIPSYYISEIEKYQFEAFPYIVFDIYSREWSSYQEFVYWCLEKLLTESLTVAPKLLTFAADADLVIAHPLCPLAQIVADYYKIPLIELLISSVYIREDERTEQFYNSMWLEKLNECRFSLGLPYTNTTSLSTLKTDNLKITLFPKELIAGEENPNLVYGNFIQYYQEDNIEPALETFFADGSAPIAVTLGRDVGFLTAPMNFMETIEKLADTGERFVVFTRGAYKTKNKNIYVYAGTAPHHKIFPRCSAVINHGGIGTIAKCLESNTPQIIVPQMSENAANAEHFKQFCAVIDPSEFTFEKIKYTLETQFYDYEEGCKFKNLLNTIDGIQIIIQTLINHKYLDE